MQVGQKVVYIEKNLPEIGLIKDAVYTIADVADCNCKNGPHIDVGITSDHPFSYCPDCGAIINIDDRWFFSHTGFRLIDENSIEERMQAYLQDLNY